MNLKKLGTLLAIIQILLAIWYFDWDSWNYIIVSILLFIGGTCGILTEIKSGFLIRIKELLQIIGVTIVILFLIKLIFVG